MEKQLNSTPTSSLPIINGNLETALTSTESDTGHKSRSAGLKCI